MNYVRSGYLIHSYFFYFPVHIMRFLRDSEATISFYGQQKPRMILLKLLIIKQEFTIKKLTLR